MKETYIRFRCSEEEKAIIEAMALQDKDSNSMSEYILNLVKKDTKAAKRIEIFAIVMNAGKVVSKTSCGVYLFSEDGRASKELYKKVEEIGQQCKTKNGDMVVYATSDGELLATNILSDECWLMK